MLQGSSLFLSQLRNRQRPGKLELPVKVVREGLIYKDREEVLRGKGLRLIAYYSKLHRMLVWSRLDEAIEAREERVEVFLFFWLKRCDGHIGIPREPEDTSEPICFECVLPEELREPSLRHPLEDIHLPETILAHGIACPEGEVVLMLSKDVGNAVSIPYDLNVSRDTFDFIAPGVVRKRRPNPEEDASDRKDNDDDENTYYLADGLHVFPP